MKAENFHPSSKRKETCACEFRVVWLKVIECGLNGERSHANRNLFSLFFSLFFMCSRPNYLATSGREVKGARVTYALRLGEVADIVDNTLHKGMACPSN